MLPQPSLFAFLPGERLIEVPFDGERNITLSEKEKMLAGELYRSTGSELQAAMAEVQQHLRRLNAIPNEDFERRFVVLHALLGQIGSSTQIKSPFACDYGVHIRIGRNGFVNYGCVFLDCNLITIEDDAQIGPGVNIYTAFHPLEADMRRSGLEGAKPVTIGHRIGAKAGGWVLWNKPWNPVFEYRETLEWRFYSYGSTIANGATSPRRSVECTKDAVRKCSPEAMKGLPIKQHSFMLVWIASSFLCGVCIACLLRGEWHSQKQRQGHNIGMKP